MEAEIMELKRRRSEMDQVHENIATLPLKEYESYWSKRIALNHKINALTKNQKLGWKN